MMLKDLTSLALHCEVMKNISTDMLLDPENDDFGVGYAGGQRAAYEELEGAIRRIIQRTTEVSTEPKS